MVLCSANSGSLRLSGYLLWILNSGCLLDFIVLCAATWKLSVETWAVRGVTSSITDHRQPDVQCLETISYIYIFIFRKFISGRRLNLFPVIPSCPITFQFFILSYIIVNSSFLPFLVWSIGRCTQCFLWVWFITWVYLNCMEERDKTEKKHHHLTALPLPIKWMLSGALVIEFLFHLSDNFRPYSCITGTSLLTPAGIVWPSLSSFPLFFIIMCNLIDW